MTTEYLAAVFGQFSPLTTLRLADQPAARQMLMNRIDINYNTSNTDYQNFQTELRTQWAFPVNIRNVAISNGNECAIDQEYTAGSALLYYDLDAQTRIGAELFDIFNGGVVSGLYGALTPAIPFQIPGRNRFHITLDVRTLVNGGGNQVYYGNMSYTKKILWLVPVTLTVANKTYNAPSGLLPLDTYPGGFYTISFGGLPNSVVNNSFQTFNSNFNIKYRFAFVHTASALCIGGGNQTLTNTQYMARYIGATPPAAPFNTPFQNFTTAFNADGAVWDFEDATTRRLNNEPHEHFFIRNANWLAAELTRVDPAPGPASNCSAFCDNLTISGTATLCTSATYSVQAITGAIYTWAALPAGSVSFSGSGNTVTATKNASFNGSATIRVTIATANCGSIVLNKTVAAGKINISSINVTYNSPSNSAQPLYPLAKFDLTTYYDACLSLRIIPTNIPSGATVTWSATAPGATWQQVGNYFVCFFNALNQTADVTLSITNGCGPSSAHYRFRCVNSGLCGGPTPARTIVSPNPAQQTVTVTLNEEYNMAAKAGMLAQSGNKIAQVKIYNVHGVAVKTAQYTGMTKQVQVDITGLLPGLYFVEVSDGIHKQTSKLVISR